MELLVQTYLKEHGIEALEQEFAIKVKRYPDEGLLVLNYNQIDSPKTHPIVIECRGLILDYDYNVVSRAFDRFFNYGEADTTTKVDFSKASIYTKVDGSLIKIYNYKGTWYISTKGTAFAEPTVNGFDVTFKELALKAINRTWEEFQKAADLYLNPECTYLCELTSMENRCVTRYEGYTLHYLATRHNQTGKYLSISLGASEFGFVPTHSFSFDTVEACIEASKALPNLEEGYVVYQDGAPVAKIKSPAYCAVHLIKGEGLTPKRITELVLTGEEDEYLTYFPEDAVHINPYVEAQETLLCSTGIAWMANRHLESQKDFALAVKDLPYCKLLFELRKNPTLSVDTIWALQRDGSRVDLVLQQHALIQKIKEVSIDAERLHRY